MGTAQCWFSPGLRLHLTPLLTCRKPAGARGDFKAALLSCAKLAILTQPPQHICSTFIFRNMGKTVFSWLASNPQISFNRSHVVLMGRSPLQELFWRLVPPFSSLSRLPLFFISQHIHHWLISLPLFYTLPQDLSGLHPYFTAACQRTSTKSFSEESWSQKNLFQAEPFPCHAASPLLGAAWGGWALQEPSLPWCQTFCRGGRPAIQQLSWDHPWTQLCLWGSSTVSLSFPKNQIVVSKFRKRKGKWKKKSWPRLLSGLAQVWGMSCFFPCVLPATKLIACLLFSKGFCSPSLQSIFNRRGGCVTVICATTKPWRSMGCLVISVPVTPCFAFGPLWTVTQLGNCFYPFWLNIIYFLA